ncbi:MAG: 2-succinyl-5-enolpyruvyl-6-hydroxy-3-cyclohexene-1-carboxylic-acid synthase, partial [Actinobacteria bacterium]|nr:2-succinyl-5-enolpyruvyl-6-hydroxy-3-cyclohexene-1-carboxylic-acid synthase [Actinomycetota bacterium]
DAVLAPGSRSAPLALALAGDSRVRLSVFLDERSASFFALGAAKASGRPVVVLSTSGTAAATFHPAVLEAWYARVPLVVCTADRPPELRDTGAGQAVDQIKLFGDAVRWFAEVGVPEDVPGAGRYWRSVAARSWAAAQGPPAGPVHLNLAFREPLLPTGGPPVAAPGRPASEPWVTSSGLGLLPPPGEVGAAAAEVDSRPRGLVVVGWGAGVSAGSVDRLARAAGWPVLADAVSGVRSGRNAVSTYDPLVRLPAFASAWKPDVVLHLGAPLTNRSATAWLDSSVDRILVDPDNVWLDPQRSASRRVVGDPEALLAGVFDRLCGPGANDAWLGGWMRAEHCARQALDGVLDSWEDVFEGRVVRDVVASLPDGAAVVVGSSMPVRDAESFTAARSGLRWFSNRGANGIDGFVSTVLGVASAADGASPTVGLLGDLTFLHDAGGLLGAADRGLNAVFVVLDNNGGGVFSFLPQADLPDHFETLFGTPHGLDLASLAAAYGIPAQRVIRAAEVVPAVQEAMAGGGVRLVVVPSDRTENVLRHRKAWAAVAEAVEAAGLV